MEFVGVLICVIILLICRTLILPVAGAKESRVLWTMLMNGIHPHPAHGLHVSGLVQLKLCLLIETLRVPSPWFASPSWCCCPLQLRRKWGLIHLLEIVLSLYLASMAVALMAEFEMALSDSLIACIALSPRTCLQLLLAVPCRLW